MAARLENPVQLSKDGHRLRKIIDRDTANYHVRSIVRDLAQAWVLVEIFDEESREMSIS